MLTGRMIAGLVNVDPNSPQPPFEIEKVFIARGTTDIPTPDAKQAHMIICVAGSAEVDIQGDVVETYQLRDPGTALLVPAGTRIISISGTDNLSTIVFAGA
jgi:hypothetical protein